MGQKVIIVLVGYRAIVCVQKPPYHFLQTLHPLRVFKIVFRDSSLYPKQSLFCLLRLISASADRIGYIRRTIARAQKQQFLAEKYSGI